MKYSNETVKTILMHIELGNTQKDASALEGVGESTWQAWKVKHVELQDLVKKAESKCKALHIANVRRHAFGLEGVAVRWTASAWWLERKYPEEFALRWAGQLSGPGGKPLIPEQQVAQVDTSRFTKEQLDKLIVAMDLATLNLKGKAMKANGHPDGNGTA